MRFWRPSQHFLTAGLDRLLQTLKRASPMDRWALSGAGVALTFVLLVIIVILWRGGWAVATEEQRIWYLGVLGILMAVLLGLVVSRLANVQVTFKGGKDGFEGNFNPEDAPASVVTTTTETRVEAPKP